MTTKPKTRKAKGQNTSLDTIDAGEERLAEGEPGRACAFGGEITPRATRALP
jgi:hypothetical protein